MSAPLGRLTQGTAVVWGGLGGAINLLQGDFIVTGVHMFGGIVMFAAGSALARRSKLYAR